MLEKNKIYKISCIKNFECHYINFTKGKVYNFYVEDLNHLNSLGLNEDTMWVFENITRKDYGYRFYLMSENKFEEYFSLKKEIRKQKLKKLNYEKN